MLFDEFVMVACAANHWRVCVGAIAYRGEVRVYTGPNPDPARETNRQKFQRGMSLDSIEHVLSHGRRAEALALPRHVLARPVAAVIIHASLRGKLFGGFA